LSLIDNIKVIFQQIVICELKIKLWLLHYNYWFQHIYTICTTKPSGGFYIFFIKLLRHFHVKIIKYTSIWCHCVLEIKVRVTANLPYNLIFLQRYSKKKRIYLTWKYFPLLLFLLSYLPYFSVVNCKYLH
jgi:hypothetical protein